MPVRKVQWYQEEGLRWVYGIYPIERSKEERTRGLCEYAYIDQQGVRRKDFVWMVTYRCKKNPIRGHTSSLIEAMGLAERVVWEIAGDTESDAIGKFLSHKRKEKAAFYIRTLDYEMLRVKGVFVIDTEYFDPHTSEYGPARLAFSDDIDGNSGRLLAFILGLDILPRMSLEGFYHHRLRNKTEIEIARKAGAVRMSREQMDILMMGVDNE